MLQFPVHIIQVSCDYHVITIQVSCDYHVTYQKNSSFESLPTAETHQLSTQSLKVVGGKLIQYAAGKQNGTVVASAERGRTHDILAIAVCPVYPLFDIVLRCVNEIRSWGLCHL